MIVAVSCWIDEERKEHPGFAHAFMMENFSEETIDSVLKRLSLPGEEIRPSVEIIQTDGWRSYEAASDELGVICCRAVLRDLKDSMKILPWIHQFIANAKSVFRDPHRGVSKKHLQRYLASLESW